MSLIGVFSSGDVIENRYHLDFLVHEGRWGDIYRATDRLNDRPVALRFFPISEDGPAQYERFTSHARELNGMSAPGLLTPIDHGMAREIPYLVSRWAKGQSLKDYLAEFGTLNVGQSLILIEHLLRALRSAHKAQLAHGLIRPTKIFVHDLDGDSPLIKLVDFQIWRFYEWSSGEDAFDQQNLSRRVIRYTAPEVINDQRILPATDLFGIGLVALEALQGEPALDENDRIALIGRQVSDEVFELPDDVPASDGLRAYLSLLLDKEISARFEHAGTALDAFHANQAEFNAPTVKRKTTPGQNESDAEEELFGKDPDQVRALSDGERLDGSSDRDDPLFEEGTDFGDYYDEDQPASSNSKPGEQSSAAGPKDDQDDADDELDPTIADEVPSASHRDRILTANETRAKSSSGPGPLDDEDDEQSLQVAALISIAALAVIAIASYFLIFHDSGDPAMAQEQPTEAAAETEDQTYIIEIHTDPPAQRVLVAGATEGMSPLQVEVADSDFPLEIRARKDANNIQEKILEAPQDLVTFSFD